MTLHPTRGKVARSTELAGLAAVRHQVKVRRVKSLLASLMMHSPPSNCRGGGIGGIEPIKDRQNRHHGENPPSAPVFTPPHLLRTDWYRLTNCRLYPHAAGRLPSDVEPGATSSHASQRDEAFLIGEVFDCQFGRLVFRCLVLAPHAI